LRGAHAGSCPEIAEWVGFPKPAEARCCYASQTSANLLPARVSWQ
jgi:hypothetical protein